MTPFLPRLHAAIAEATPGPWEMHGSISENFAVKASDSHGRMFLGIGGLIPETDVDAEARLIVLLWFAAPKIAAALEAASALKAYINPRAIRDSKDDYFISVTATSAEWRALRDALAALDGEG